MENKVTQMERGSFKEVFTEQSELETFLTSRSTRTYAHMDVHPDGSIFISVTRDNNEIFSMSIPPETEPVRVMCNYTPDDGRTRCKCKAGTHLRLKWPKASQSVKDKVYHLCSAHAKLFDRDIKYQKLIAEGTVVVTERVESATLPASFIEAMP